MKVEVEPPEPSTESESVASASESVVSDSESEPEPHIPFSEHCQSGSDSFSSLSEALRFVMAIFFVFGFGLALLDSV